MKNRFSKQRSFRLAAVFLFLVSVPVPLFAQKSDFSSGMLAYKITARDTSLKSILPDNEMFLYTNDTLVRTENFTQQLGKQVVIRHIEKNKSYLLLDTPIGKYAIQTDHSKADTAKNLYTYKKKFFRKKILGMKANRVMVSHPDFNEPIEFWYLKNVSSNYIPSFPGLPGLPVKYSLSTADGIINYELKRMSSYTPNRDLFGIPSDFKRVSFDEFLELMISGENPPENTPD